MEVSSKHTTTDFELCIKCQLPGGSLVAHPRPDSYSKFLTGVKKLAKCGLVDFVEIYQRLSTHAFQDLLERNAKWHAACYKDAIQVEKLDRAKKAYRQKAGERTETQIISGSRNDEGGIQDSQGQKPMCFRQAAHQRMRKPAQKKKVAQCISTPTIPGSSNDKVDISVHDVQEELLSSTAAEPQSMGGPVCFFCNEGCTRKQKLHNVSRVNIDKKVIEAIAKSNNKEWQQKLQPLNPDNPKAIDLQYHCYCYVKYVSRAGNEKKRAIASNEAVLLASVDTEFCSNLRNMLSNNKYISMDAIRDVYQELLDSHGLSRTVISRIVKRKMLEQMPDEIEFFRPRMNCSEIVCYSAAKSRAVRAAADFVLLGKIAGINLLPEEAMCDEPFHNLCVKRDHEPYTPNDAKEAVGVGKFAFSRSCQRRTKVSSFGKNSSSRTDIDHSTAINRPKRASVLKAQQAWKEVLNTESDVDSSHILSDHACTVDKKNDGHEVVIQDPVSNTGHEQPDVDFPDKFSPQQPEVNTINVKNLTTDAIDMADDENDSDSDDPNWYSSTSNRIVKHGIVSECIFHCSPSKYSGKLFSPNSMESWHILLNAASIWKYRDILDIAEKIKTCDDLKAVKYHNNCRKYFALKSILEIIKCSELNNGATQSSSGTNDLVSNGENGECLSSVSNGWSGTGHSAVNTVLRPDLNGDVEPSSSENEVACDPAGNITNPNTISQCLIHCCLHAEHDTLHSPLSMKAWSRILRAARVWKYQYILDIAEKIKGDADLQIVKFHSKCWKYFTMNCTLEIRQRQELNTSKTKCLSSTNGNISSDEDDDCIHCYVAARHENEDDYLDWNLSKENTNSSAISECIIHCSHSADYAPLCSPQSMKLWYVLMNAGRILNYQKILDIAEKIETDADLHLVRYHNTCLKLFTMKTVLMTNRQEANCIKTPLLFPLDQCVSDGNLLPDETEFATTDLGFSGDLCDLSKDSDNFAENGTVHPFPQSSASFNLPANQNTHPVNTTLNKHLEGMAAVLLQYRVNHFLCDALVLVDDGEIQAHSVILSAASPVFKAAFTIPNISHCVRVSHVNMDVMKLVLDAIYTGQIECEDEKRFTVRDVLVRLEVDIGKLKEGEKYKVAAEDINVNRENVHCDDDPTICFNSIDALDSEMNNIVDQITSFNDGNDFGLDQMGINRVTDVKCFTNMKKSLSCDNYQMVGYQCSAVTPEQKKRLLEQYLSLCDRKQSLMLVSLVEVKHPAPHAVGNTGMQRKNIWIDKYFLPVDETLRRIHVCRKTFRQVFSINKHKLYERISAGFKFKYENAKAVESSPTDLHRLNAKQEERNIADDTSNEQRNDGSFIDTLESSLTALLSADCQCKQCKGKYQCTYCGHKSMTRSYHLNHFKLCVKAQSLAAINGYGCSYCSRTFSTRNERTEHIWAHHGKDKEKRHNVCDICDKRFKSRQGLKNHRVMVHKGGLYLCQVCGKKCYSRSNLLGHVAIHGREKIVREFRCDLCPEKFKRCLMCIRHKEKVHGVIEPRVSVYCDKCGRRFGGVNAMRYHQRLFCRARNRAD